MKLVTGEEKVIGIITKEAKGKGVLGGMIMNHTGRRVPNTEKILTAGTREVLNEISRSGRRKKTLGMEEAVRNIFAKI